MSIVKTILKEAGELIIPNIPGASNYWHGGNLDDYDNTLAQKNGRYEYGPGLYVTTHYDTAKKYAKGSRKLYLVTVADGKDINDAWLSLDEVNEFADTFVIRSKRNEFAERLDKYVNADDKVKASIFNNIILNSKAIKSTNTKELRNFYINNGIDYEIVDNAFGWGEKMLVLYNMKKIVNVIQIKPTDKITTYNLHY